MKVHSGARNYILSSPDSVQITVVIFNNQMIGIVYILVLHVQNILFSVTSGSLKREGMHLLKVTPINLIEG